MSFFTTRNDFNQYGEKIFSRELLGSALCNLIPTDAHFRRSEDGIMYINDAWLHYDSSMVIDPRNCYAEINGSAYNIIKVEDGSYFTQTNYARVMYYVGGPEEGINKIDQ